MHLSTGESDSHHLNAIVSSSPGRLDGSGTVGGTECHPCSVPNRNVQPGHNHEETVR